MTTPRRLFLFLVALCTAGYPLTSAIAGEPIRPTNRIRLFNGKDLDGLSTWLKSTKTADPKGVFKVENGELHLSGEGFGYVGTKNSYRDYRLVVEYKWGKRTDGGKHVRNSGVLLHATGLDGNASGTWMSSIECQLAQGCVGDLIPIRGKDAKGEIIPVQFASTATVGDDKRPRFDAAGQKKLFIKGQLWWNDHEVGFKELLDTRGKNDADSPLGEWTKVECVCKGSEILVRVNGRLVNRCFDATPSAGRILLQTEGFEVFFRNFELYPIGMAK